MPRTTRSTGLLLAFASALIGGGVVLFVFISHKPKPAGAGDGAAPIEPVDITAVGGGAKQAIIEIADKKDPTRRAGQFVFDRLNQLSPGFYETDHPKAWLYLKDGRTIYVRADSGKVRIPGGGSGTPESGEFTGNGLLLLFPPRPAAAAGGAPEPIDPEHDVPGLTARFTTINFDTVLLEMSSQQDVLIQSPQVDALLHGLLVRFDQVDNRVEFAKVAQGGTVRTHVRTGDTGSSATPAPATSPATPAAPTAAAGAEKGEHAGSDRAGHEMVGPPEPPPPSPMTVEYVKMDRYRAVFNREVTLTQLTRTLAADTLTVFGRLENNKLPPNAFGPEEDKKPGKPRKPRGGRDQMGGGVESQQRTTITQLAPAIISTLLAVPAPRNLFTPEEDDVILAWTGPMNMSPLAAGAEVPELANLNHLHARFSSEVPGGRDKVDLTDSQTGAVGACGELDYAASLGHLTLQASAPGKADQAAQRELFDRVDMYVPGVGRFAAPLFTVNLFSGVAQARGRGSMTSLQTDQVTVVPAADLTAPIPEDLVQQVRWTDQADFEFLTREGRIAADGGGLKSARFAGGVVARDRWSFISSETLGAEFVQFHPLEFPTPEPVLTKPVSILTRLRAAGDVAAVLAPGKIDPERPLPAPEPYLSAQAMDMRFATPAPGARNAREPEPKHLLATGDVRASDTRSTIWCGRLDSDLLKDARGRVAFGDVLAQHEVRVEGKDGVFAIADTLKADGRRRVADLMGDEVKLGLGNAVITAQQAHMEEDRGLLEIFGRGVFDLVDAPPGSTFDPARVNLAQLDPKSLPPGVTVTRAVWDKSMTFVNATGRLECHGTTQTTQASSEGGRVSRANRVYIDLTPEGQKSEAVAGSGEPGIGAASFSLAGLGSGGSNSRQVLRAEAVGAVVEDSAGAPASVKAWKYAAGESAEKPFDQVLYLEGPRIIADQKAQTVSVPEAGRGVMFDRGSSTPAPASPTLSAGSAASSSPFAGSSAAGDTMFTWKGSMLFDQAGEELTLERDVELKHRPLEATEAGSGIRMNCQKVVAKFTGAKQGSKGAQLVSADATGGVFAESGVQNLTADTMNYQAGSQLAMAIALGDVPVSYTNTANATPVLARRLEWNLKVQSGRVIDPWATIAPLPK